MSEEKRIDKITANFWKKKTQKALISNTDNYKWKVVPIYKTEQKKKTLFLIDHNQLHIIKYPIIILEIDKDFCTVYLGARNDIKY